MARSLSDRDGGIRNAASLVALLLMLQPPGATAAALGGTFEIIRYSNMEINVRDDTLTVEDVVITHGPATRVEARFARQTSRPGNVKQLDLSGGVKIDYEGATLSADAAVMMFRGDQLLSVQVDDTPAEFSHQPGGFRRIFGQANTIHLDATTDQLVFSGDTSYTDGCNRLTSARVTYDMQAGTVVDAGHPLTAGRAVLCLDENQDALQITRYANLVIDVREDTIRADNVVIEHGSTARAEAQSARQGRIGGNVKQLELTGAVRIEFDGGTLDAASAKVAFNGDQLISAEVSGERVEFSHQPEGFPRRIQGRAGNIRYETATGKAVFSGETFFTDGCTSITTRNPFSYDIYTGAGSDDGDPQTRGRTSHACLNPGRDRIPTPRTPERDSAQ